MQCNPVTSWKKIKTFASSQILWVWRCQWEDISIHFVKGSTQVKILQTVMETCREEVIQTKARDAEGLTVLETRREELAIRGIGAAQGKQGCRTVGGWNQTELSCQGKEIRRYEVFLWLTTWYLYWYKVTLILQRTEGQRITFLLQWNYRWSLRVHILCWDER